jgi:hypothetical protein
MPVMPPLAAHVVTHQLAEGERKLKIINALLARAAVPDPGEQWLSRLVATATEDRFRAARHRLGDTAPTRTRLKSNPQINVNY